MLAIVYQCINVQFPRVLFIDSRLNLISFLEALRIFNNSLDDGDCRLRPARAAIATNEI